MAGDLGMADGEVHAGSRAVLDFWFHDTPDERRWGKDAAFDAAIAERFGELRGRLLATDAAGWRDDPAALLAAVIVLDQFSRNMFRGRRQAFAADPLALSLTRTALERRWEERYGEEERWFLFMPLIHAEDRATQDESVARFAALGREKPLRFAREHRDVIARFGRFPSRNAVLGRQSTLAEEEYLRQPGAGW